MVSSSTSVNPVINSLMRPKDRLIANHLFCPFERRVVCPMATHSTWYVLGLYRKRSGEMSLPEGREIGGRSVFDTAT
jgi:hypothetical protein